MRQPRSIMNIGGSYPNRFIETILLSSKSVTESSLVNQNQNH